MQKILFWNLGRKDLSAVVARLAQHHGADLVVLAESGATAASLLDKLNAEPSQPIYHYTSSNCDAILMFSRLSADLVTPEAESSRVTVRRVAMPALPEFLLTAVHLPSPLYQSRESQAAELVELSRMIRGVEYRRGNDRTVVIGDFNVSPFDPGMVSTIGLHAVMTADVARRKHRSVQGRRYPFFYNPMWKLMGAEAPGPPGSYYYERAEHVQYFWHSFDQVLVRPSLIDSLPDDPAEWLTSEPAGSLVDSRGHPESHSYSDHLPVMLRLDLSLIGAADGTQSAQPA